MSLELGYIPVGNAARLMSVEQLRVALQMTSAEVTEFLDALQVPRMMVPLGSTGQDHEYFSAYVLESSLFWVLLPKKPNEFVEPRGWFGDTPSAQLARAHQEMASVMYGACNREAVIKRVLELARQMVYRSKRANTRLGKKQPKETPRAPS